MNKKRYPELEAVLDYSFNTLELMHEAFTHPSFVSEQKVKQPHNQRMEYLGDAVIELIVTKSLYNNFPDLQEGAMSQRRAALTNQQGLASLAQFLKLSDYLALGRGEKRNGGASRPSNLCDVFEALIASIYLDSSFEEAERVFWRVVDLAGFDLENAIEHFNPKGALQEYTQSRFHKLPTYEQVSVSGPQHQPLYQVQIVFEGEVLSKGEGTSRSKADEAAARLALKVLKEKGQ